MFEIELIICIKMDLVLNNLQKLIRHKKQTNSSNKCPGYDTKQSDGEVPVMLELWGMHSTPLLLSLPGLLRLRMVALDRVLCIAQIELNCVLVPNWIVWNGTLFVCYNEFFEMELFLDMVILLMLNWTFWNGIVVDVESVYLH